ncbi:MAG: hypothetical protein M1822_002818 [Bathelium mastoideum]|nr:MAG: hypothetical protein M1822_002818 [Bathelium mastoideum]
MQKIKAIEDLDTEPLPCNYFDMICGTSTGGIIAIMVGRLRMSVSDCIKVYLEMSREVFGKPQNVIPRERFSPEVLEDVIKRIVQAKIGHENAPLMDLNAEHSSFVCTSDIKAMGGSPVLLRTYETGSASINCQIWEAARATSAAPTFFPPIKFQERTGNEFIDAAIGCNNPTKELIKEAKSYYRLKGYNLSKPTCIVSIGTGQKDLIQLHKAASVFWFKDRTGLSIAPVLANIVTDCENTHDEVALSCIEEHLTNRYFRFNAPQGMQNIVLDEWEKLDDIRTYTDKYMRLNQTENELLRCVALLRCMAENEGCNEDIRDGQPGRLGHSVSRITQGGSSFGDTIVTGGASYQGHFAGYGNDSFSG